MEAQEPNEANRGTQTLGRRRERVWLRRASQVTSCQVEHVTARKAAWPARIPLTVKRTAAHTVMAFAFLLPQGHARLQRCDTLRRGKHTPLERFALGARLCLRGVTLLLVLHV